MISKNKKSILIFGFIFLMLIAVVGMVVAEEITLDNSNAQKVFTYNSIKYNIELVSASDSSSTLKISQTKEINEGSSNTIGGIPVNVISSDEQNIELSTIITINNQELELNNTNSIKSFNYNGETYSVELVSASDSSSTLKVYQIKEINEGDVKNMLGISIAVKEADETNEKLSANIVIGEAIEKNEENLAKNEEQISEEQINEIVPEEPVVLTEEEKCGACLLDDKCYPFNYRIGGKYCNMNQEFVSQLTTESVCNNDFECESNLCIDGKCVSSGLWQKIMSWFKTLFGGE